MVVTYRQSLLAVAILILASISTGIMGQETPFHYYGPYSTDHEFFGNYYTLNNVQVNSLNRCYALIEYTQWNMGDDGYSYYLSSCDTDNVPDTIGVEIVQFNYTRCDNNMALFGTGVAFPCVSGNQFYWRYYDTVNNNVVSDSLELPFSNIGWMSISQNDEEHALLIFKEYNAGYFVAYVDAQAQPIWSYSIPSGIVGAEDVALSGATLIDSNHFIMGVRTFDPDTFKLINLNSSAGQEHTETIEVDYNAQMFPTKIPGTVLISYLHDNVTYFAKYSNQVLTNLISPVNELYYMMAAADESGFLFMGRAGSGWLRMYKYDWSGNMLWNKYWPASTYGKQYNLDVSSTGNYYMGLSTQGRYLFAKVMADGETTDADDNTEFPGQKISVYPNPFSSVMSIDFDKSANGYNELAVYNLKGQKVKSISPGNLAKGKHSFSWDGRTEHGAVCSSGVYFIRVNGSGKAQVKKVVFLQ